MAFSAHSSAQNCQLENWAAQQNSLLEGLATGSGDVTRLVISYYNSQMVETGWLDGWSGTLIMILPPYQSVISVIVIGLTNHWSQLIKYQPWTINIFLLPLQFPNLE